MQRGVDNKVILGHLGGSTGRLDAIRTNILCEKKRATRSFRCRDWDIGAMGGRR